MLFALILIIIVLAIGVNAVKKADREDDTRLHRQLEAAEARKILEARARQNNERMQTAQFRIAGTSYRRDALMHFAEENEDYNATKRERVENGEDGDREYKYDFHVSSATLTPEPENPHDPNAIRVDFDGITVGYIPRTDCRKVRAMMDSGRISAIVPEIYGGPFKELALDPNFDDSEREPRFSDYDLINDETEIGAKITIKLLKDDADSKHCTHCGAAVKDSDIYCQHCGAKL